MLSRKILFLLSFSFISFFSVQNAMAQYPGMRAVYTQMNRQWANQQMNLTLMRGLNMNYDIVNRKYTYQVVLKDSTKLSVDSKIYNDTSAHKNYILLVDKSFKKSDTAHRTRKIYADQTVNISRIQKFMGNNPVIKGLPNDSCWMFKTVNGAINVYSYLSEQGYDYSSSTVAGIQLGTGPIERFDPDHLKAMIAGDADAMKIFDKKNYYKALVRFNKNTEKALKPKSTKASEEPNDYTQPVGND